MATHSNFSSAFKSMYRKLQSTQRTLPSVLANVGTNFFISNFDKEGFQDDSLERWKPRQAKGKVKKKDQTRKILVKSGKLKRAVNKSVKEKSFKRIVWQVSGIPYAAVHNDGFKGLQYVKSYSRDLIGKKKEATGTYSIKTRKVNTRTVKYVKGQSVVSEHVRQINIPQRKFMGPSRTLNTLFRKKIIEAYKKSLNG